MIAKVLTRQGKTWKSFKQLDEYIERFEACVATKHGNLSEELPVPDQMDEVADKGTGRVRNPAYHFVLSWDKGNIPNQQMWSTVEKALTVLGCEKHQWVAARHADSKFEHCHVLVNRIHPNTHRAWTPQYDYLKLRGLCRQLDPRWKLRDESNAPSSRAADFETWTGQQSMQTWGREHILSAFESTINAKKPNWKRFHAIIGERTGTTYEVSGGVGFIVDRTGLRPRRVRAAAISRKLTKENLEKNFGEAWSQAPYGIAPKKERGYGYDLERWQVPIPAVTHPSVEKLYQRFILEQKRWKNIGKWVAKDERRIVNESLKRDTAAAEVDAQEAMMLLRSVGGVQGETARMVLSMLVRYDADRAEKEAKAQISKITAKRPAELFRQWLKDRAAEGDVAAGVALIRLKNQPLDSEAIISLLDLSEQDNQEMTDMEQKEITQVAEKVLEFTRELKGMDPANESRPLPSLESDQQSAQEDAIKILKENEQARKDYLALIVAFNNLGATPEEKTFATPALLAVAGVDVFKRETIMAVYPRALDDVRHSKIDDEDHYPYAYIQLGEKYAQALKSKQKPGTPLSDKDLTSSQEAIKSALYGPLQNGIRSGGVLNSKRPTWQAVYDALEPHGLTYGVYYGQNRDGKEYRGGGLYLNENDYYKYSQVPSVLDLGINKIEKRLGSIVDPGHPASTMTLEERKKNKAIAEDINKERQQKFNDAAKKHGDEIKKGNSKKQDQVNNVVTEAVRTTNSVDNGSAEDEDLLAQENTLQENEEDQERTLGSAPSREKKNQENEYSIENEELAELHGNLHGKYSIYMQQFGSGLYDVQRGLYKEREAIIFEKIGEEFKKITKERGSEQTNSISIAYVERLKALGALEDAWIRESDILEEAIGNGPQTYSEWLRERKEEKAKNLADVVEKQERKEQYIYRPIKGDQYLVLTKNLDWEANESGVQYSYSGKPAFSDDGTMLKIVSSKDKEAMQVALILANEKYGFPEDNRKKGVYLTGSIAYKRRMVEIAAEIGIPIANEELQPLYKQKHQEHLDEQRAHEKEQKENPKEPSILHKRIVEIQKDASMDPENAKTPEEKQEKFNGRNNLIDDAIAQAAARHYDDERSEPVRILEKEEMAQGELENVLMFNGRCYAVVRTASEQKGKAKPEIVLARVTREQGKAMLNQIGREILVERPLAGLEHEIEYVQDRNKGGRTR